MKLDELSTVPATWFPVSAIEITGSHLHYYKAHFLSQ